MKSGAAEDPFENMDDEEDDEQGENQTDDDTMTETTTDSTTETRSREDYPYTMRRGNVKDERDEVHQLFVQDETHTRARDAERDLEDRLDDDVYRLDAREAIYLAGMMNLDDAEDVLRGWGYDL